LFLYFFTMEHESIMKFIRNGIRFAVFSIVAAGMASFTLLSFYNSVTNSGYVESDSASSESINIFSQSLLANLNDIQVMHQISRANIDFTAANTYCGILLIMLIPAFLFLKKKSLSSRIIRILLIVLLYFAYGNELLNYVFHGFHFQTLVPNRFSLFFIFLVIDTFYDVISDYKVLFEKKTLATYGVFSLVLMFISYYCCGGSISYKLINAAFILSYLGVLLAGYIKKNHYHYLRVLLLILCVELGASTMHTIKSAFKGSLLLSTHDINTVNELTSRYYGDEDRIVKASMPTQDATNLACIAGFNSVDVFTSSLQQEQIDMSDYWGIEHGPNYLSYDMGNPFADIALKVKGFYLYDGIIQSNIPSYVEKKASLNSVALYENGYVPDIGILFSSEIMDVDIKDFDNAFEYQNYLSRLLVEEDLYDIIDLAEQPMIDGEIEDDILVDEGLDVELPDDNQTDEMDLEETQQEKTENKSDIFDCVISKAGSEVSYRIDRREEMHDLFIAASNRIVFGGNVDYMEDDIISTSIRLTKQEAASLEREGFGSISAAMLNKDTLELIKDYLNTKCISNLKADNFGISGDITVDYDGYVFIPTFMYDGWKTTVDGTEVKTEKILGGTGIPVTKGKHSIQISKNKQVYIKQYYLTIASLIIFVMIIIVLKMKFSSEKKTKQ
ncbi:MAG: YfhO family protein, partial [Eubacterium sp.]|nr:YfhO family protein [Eubacterium sp.]